MWSSCSSGDITRGWIIARSTALLTSTRASCCVEIKHRVDGVRRLKFDSYTGEPPNELRIALIRAQGLAIACVELNQ